MTRMKKGRYIKRRNKAKFGKERLANLDTK